MACDSLSRTGDGPVSHRPIEESKMAKPARVRSLVVALVWARSAKAPFVGVPAFTSEPGFISVSPARPVCIS